MYLNLIPQYKSDLENFISGEGFTRTGKLGLIHTMGHVLHMAANRSKEGYDISSQKYFAELSAHMKDETPLPGVSRSTFCEARQKISWKAFEFLFKQVGIKKEELSEDQKWNEHAVYASDGTKITLPHSEEIIKNFPQKKAGGIEGFCHYPFGTLVTICNLFTGQPVAAEFGNKHSSERDFTLSLLNSLGQGDILLLDRGLDGFKIWSACDEKEIFYVGRLRIMPEKMKERLGLFGQINAFLKSGKRDKVIELKRNTQSIKMRLVRGPKIKDGSILILGTNLLDKKRYKSNEIVGLYAARWKIETFYSRVKTLLKVEEFHSKKTNGVLQELFANLIIIALMCRLSLYAVREQKLSTTGAPNFKNIIEVFRRYFFYWISPFQVGPFRLKQIQISIIFQISRILCKKQPGRSYPRYSRAPINKWTMCKRDKIKQHKLGRRPGTSAGMKAKYKRIDQEQQKAA